MVFLISIFLISLILISYVLGTQVAKIRRGQVSAEMELPLHRHLPKINFRRYYLHLLELGKDYGHRAVLEALKAYVKSSYYLKRQREQLAAEIKKYSARFRKERTQKRSPVASQFLKSISEYKKKLMKIKEEIKEEHEESMKE